MIHIEKGQVLTSDATLIVTTATGDYEDTALIECTTVDNTELVVGAYQAQYVKYGDLVYRFNEPEALGKAILAIDPESTHTAASYVRMTNELLAKMNAGSLEQSSLDEVVATEKAAIEDQRVAPVEEAVTPEQPSTETPAATSSSASTPTTSPLNTDTSSTTPSVLGDFIEATSTPAAPSVLEQATSTLQDIREIETPATTTPVVPDVVLPEATTTPEALRKGGKKIAKVVRRSRG